MARQWAIALVLVLVSLIICPSLEAQDKDKDKKDEKEDGFVDVPASIEKGVAWLIKNQATDGTWNSGNFKPEVAGSTALGAYTLLKCGVPSRHPAVQKAVAYMNVHLKDRTYEVGLALMVYAALPQSERPQKKIKKLAKFLESFLTEKGWGYPGSHNGQNLSQTDLSNTQYAALGLQAAEKCGYEVRQRTWKTLAEYLMDLQENYGAFVYRKGRKPTSSMCVAGTATLIICHKKLNKSKRLRGLKNAIRGRLNLAENWFQSNWYLEQNREFGKEDKDEKRWTYYFLYGLERVGSFREVDIFAGHDWYGDGSRIIVKRQNKDGHWATDYGEKSENTCFALLFLSRGSRSTGGATQRIRAADQVEIKEDAVIRHDGKNPGTLWVQKIRGALREKLRGGAKIAKVEFTTDEGIVGLGSPESTRFLCQHDFKKNGAFEIQARIELVDAEGKALEEVLSNKIKVAIDNNLEPSDVIAIADAGRNLLRSREIEASANTEHSGRSAACAADSNGSSQWVSKAKGKDKIKVPTLTLRVKPFARANCLKLTAASPDSGDKNRWDRPKDIIITINRKTKIRMTLPDLIDGKHEISIKDHRVFMIRIKILTRYSGSDSYHHVGFREVELFKNR